MWARLTILENGVTHKWCVKSILPRADLGFEKSLSLYYRTRSVQLERRIKKREYQTISRRSNFRGCGLGPQRRDRTGSVSRLAVIVRLK